MNRAKRIRSEAGRLVHMRRRILAVYGTATEEQMEEGRRWYPNANAIAAAFDNNTARAAGVIAALSPRTDWRENVRRTGVLLAAFDRGDETPPALHTTEQVGKAWRIARGEAPLDVLAGPKERAFYSNIMGDTELVTVDVWAALVAEGRPNKNHPKDRRYGLIARAYREAAAMLGVAPAICQATTWTAVRGSAL